MPRGKRKNPTNISSRSSESTSEPLAKKSKSSGAEKASTGNNRNTVNRCKGQKKLKKNNRVHDVGQLCDVKKIVSYRINPYSTDVILECLVEWVGSGPNTWENMDNLRYNTIFQEFIHSNFSKNETDIYTEIANIKERIRKRIRKTYSWYDKWFIMHEIQPFDPFEYKAYQVYHHLLKDCVPEKFIALLEDLAYKSYFFKLEEIQRSNCSKLAADMSAMEKINVMIDNDEDFQLPPEFTYITKNFFVDDIERSIIEDDSVEKSTINGCKCTTCGPNSNCCPQLCEEAFAYKFLPSKRPGICLDRQESIIECNDRCECSVECLNRVTQQPRSLTLCLFKTKDRGWGVKNTDRKSVIKHGTFIIEYCGEVLGHHEASKREVTSYLYDLNMERKSHGYYTIDAYKYGNLARFVNHSCEPNCSMWFINDCQRNPKTQKLCIFADRDIAFDEEITIDYCPKSDIPTSSRLNYSQSFLCECHCQTKSCRGNIY